MQDVIDKTQFLKELTKGRTDWDALLAQVPEHRMTEPKADGAWTIKDIIAHVVWHERQMVSMIKGRTLRNASELWMLSTDERNDHIYKENKDRSLEEVTEEAQQVVVTLLQAAAGLTHADLNDPSRFDQMPADWVPWKIIADNTYWHYRQHTPDIEVWLEETTGAR